MSDQVVPRNMASQEIAKLRLDRLEPTFDVVFREWEEVAVPLFSRLFIGKAIKLEIMYNRRGVSRLKVLEVPDQAIFVGARVDNFKFLINLVRGSSPSAVRG